MTDRADEPTPTPTPTPWQIGTKDGGHNCSTIYDAKGNGVCNVYGLPLHATVAELQKLLRPGSQWTGGYERAAFIVRACNSHAAMLAALRRLNVMVKPIIEQFDIDPEQTEMVVSVLSGAADKEIGKLNLAAVLAEVAAAIALAEEG